MEVLTIVEDLVVSQNQRMQRIIDQNRKTDNKSVKNETKSNSKKTVKKSADNKSMKIEQKPNSI